MTDAEDLPTPDEQPGLVPGTADDSTARLLRLALEQEVADLHPDPQALSAIRERVASSTASPDRPSLSPVSSGSSAINRRPPWFLGAVGAAAATVAVITAFVVVGNSGSSPETLPAAGRHWTTHPEGTPNSATSTASPASPASSGTPSGTSSASPNMTASASAPPTQLRAGVYDPGAPAADQVTIYYVGRSTGSGPTAQFRLYPETHTVTAGADSAVAAVHEFLTSKPLDADYSSGWPPGVDVKNISTAGPVTTIALTGSVDLGTRPAPVPFDPSRQVAIQAMLATAGVQGDARFTYNGRPVHLVLYETAPAQRQSDYATRAFISIASPVEGQAVHNPVTVTGSANVFEGNLNWDLVSHGHVTASGHTTGGSMQWKPFTIKLGALRPGTYTIRAYESSAKNGQATYVDDKTFTVQ